MKTQQTWERDYRTKAFTKSDSRKHKKERSLSPEHEEVDEWITNTIQTLTEESEELQSDLDRLRNSGRNKRGDEITQKQLHLEQHQFHISKLQEVQQAFYKDRVSVSDVQELMDPIQEYLSSTVCSLLLSEIFSRSLSLSLH